jgi:transcriptional regulator with XRE-family HTH domain
MSYELSFSHAYISNILSGEKMPSLERLVAIVDYFDITLSEFFDEENASPKQSNQLYTLTKKLNDKNQELLLYLAELMLKQQG